jgi:hypothetical protein
MQTLFVTVYVDFPAGSTSIQLAIRINTLLSTTRKWNIKLTQIECNSREQGWYKAQKYVIIVT